MGTRTGPRETVSLGLLEGIWSLAARTRFESGLAGVVESEGAGEDGCCFRFLFGDAWTGYALRAGEESRRGEASMVY
jgi:hypothetical protein